MYIPTRSAIAVIAALVLPLTSMAAAGEPEIGKPAPVVIEKSGSVMIRVAMMTPSDAV